VQLAVAAQKGFMNGVLGRVRLHPVQGELRFVCSLGKLGVREANVL
jgi:hypothetical protein